MNQTQEKCCLCKGQLAEPTEHWQGGHNAQPVADGRCCTVCNDTFVLPERFKRIAEKTQEYTVCN